MPADGSGLEQLLQAEERLNRMLAEEARQAEALVAAAETEARALAERLAEEVAEATRDLEARLAAERDARLAFAEGEARRRIGCFERIGPRETDELAEWVVRQVLGGVAESA